MNEITLKGASDVTIRWDGECWKITVADEVGQRVSFYTEVEPTVRYRDVDDSCSCPASDLLYRWERR
jgi:hypothetical protein